MVQTLFIRVARKVYHLEEYITILSHRDYEHRNHCNRWYGNSSHAVEYFIGWYSGSRYEDLPTYLPGAATSFLLVGVLLIICNLVVPASSGSKN